MCENDKKKLRIEVTHKSEALVSVTKRFFIPLFEVLKIRERSLTCFFFGGVVGVGGCKHFMFNVCPDSYVTYSFAKELYQLRQCRYFSLPFYNNRKTPTISANPVCIQTPIQRQNSLSAHDKHRTGIPYCTLFRFTATLGIAPRIAANRQWRYIRV